MKKQKTSEKYFDSNLERFAHLDPLNAQRIAMIEPKKLSFCYTKADEINLQIEKDGKLDYFHSQKGAEKEARDYYAKKDLSQTAVIYLYGIGLGYDYYALKKWLKGRDTHHLVILEDDLEVLYYWMHTEMASEILQDNQVTVFAFQNIEMDRYRFTKLHSRFLTSNPLFIPLKFYTRIRGDDVYLFSYALFFDKASLTAWSNEVMQGGEPFFDSFYRNLMYLPESYSGNSLFHHFNNVPAIICGAGPSLHKNIDLLKTLSDKALIFAGGSSLNVLNEYGMNPHFGAGVDPNLEQKHRLISNHSFDLPFLYCPRMKAEALRLIQGEPLYISGSGGYDILKLFEEKMGINYPPLNGGFNVVNFSTSLARLMGCNPIIFVGLDLAYTESKTYARGIPIHPLWIEGSNPYNIDEKEEIITRKDIEGNPIKTNWKWMNESSWLYKFSMLNPEVIFINSTEGGIGFPELPNIPLKVVSETYLTNEYNFDQWIHAEIQNSKIPMATRPKMWGFIQEWKESLERCLGYCKSILSELNCMSDDDIAAKNAHISALYSPNTILTETLLEEEIAFRYLIDTYRLFYSQLQTEQLVKIHKESLQDTVFQQMSKYATILEKRYQFIVMVLEKNISTLNNAIKDFLRAPEYPLPEGIEPCNPEETLDQDQSLYKVEGDRMILEDAELDLHLDVPFDPNLEVSQDRKNGWFLLFYPDGKVEMETAYHNGQLHGPSRSFSLEGKLIAQEWFVNGKREGKSWRFFASGRLYGRRRYRDGLLDGKQELFYEDGKHKTIISYKNGVLDGEVLIYYSDGLLKRKLHYKDGRRHGKEEMWNSAGVKLVDAEYEQGVPVGVARQWSMQGDLIKEVTILEYPENFNLTAWGPNGKVASVYENGIEDTTPVYELLEQESAFLQGAVVAFMKKIEELTSDPNTPSTMQFQKEMEELRTRVKELEEMKKKMTQMFMDNQREKEEGQGEEWKQND